MDPQLRWNLHRDGTGSVRHHAGIRELLELYFAFHGKSAVIAFLRNHVDDRVGCPIHLAQMLAVIGADFGACPDPFQQIRSSVDVPLDEIACSAGLIYITQVVKGPKSGMAGGLFQTFIQLGYCVGPSFGTLVLRKTTTRLIATGFDNR
jgi:hypothetical protein